MSDEAITAAVEVPVEMPGATQSSQDASAMITQHSAFSRLPIMVKQELAKLPVEKQQAFLEEFQRKSKSTAVAYVCWFFGLHYAYMGKWGMLALYLLSGGGLLIWVIVDVFRMPGIVGNHNKDVAVQVMSELKMVSQ